ncbi:hypothetical protein LTR95_000950 [Oleoguttula sp. CCFEE 5521]
MFNSQIQIVYEKKLLDNTVRRYSSGGGIYWPIDEAKRWIESEAAKLTGYGLSKIVLRVGHERLGEKSWLANNVENFAVLFDNNIKEWHADQKKGMKLVVEGQMVAAAVPPATSHGCNDYSHLSYWGVRDSRDYHFTIYASILTQWGQAIRDGSLSADAPSSGMVQQMGMEKWRNAVRSGGKESSSSKAMAATPSTRFSFAFDSDKKVVARRTTGEALPSSPVRIPASQSS